MPILLLLLPMQSNSALCNAKVYIMVFKAKITRIFSIVESLYDLTKCVIVYDSKDCYLEVSSKVECLLLEHLNDLEKSRIETICSLHGVVNSKTIDDGGNN